MKKLIIFITPLLLALSVLAYDYDDTSTTQHDIPKLLAQARKGDAAAEYELGQAYLNGEGVKQDEKEAADWFEKAANLNNSDAQIAMGFNYRGANARQMNKILSYMWFDLAYKNGEERAVELRNNVAWSMTAPEIEEARKLSSEWKPGGKGEPPNSEGQ